MLEGRDREERRQDEEDLITFVVYLAKLFGRTYSTLQQKLYAIRYAHLVAGYNDPVLHRKRLWTTLAGLRRQQDPTQRKLPATPRMLKWLKQYLKQEAGLKPGDAAAVWGAIMIGFFFMLRASEYLVRPQIADSASKVIRGQDVCGRLENADVEKFWSADEVVVQIKSSKTDQYNEGCTRNHYRTRAELCPVEALAELQRQFPQRFGKGSESVLPLFRWADGRTITREEVQSYLQLAALADGWLPSDVGSHSLRIGGATAMAHVVNDWQQVKRFGRWKSDVFQKYIWDSHEQMARVSQGMATDDSALTRPRPTAPSV